MHSRDRSVAYTVGNLATEFHVRFSTPLFLPYPVRPLVFVLTKGTDCCQKCTCIGNCSFRLLCVHNKRSTRWERKTNETDENGRVRFDAAVRALRRSVTSNSAQCIVCARCGVHAFYPHCVTCTKEGVQSNCYCVVNKRVISQNERRRVL